MNGWTALLVVADVLGVAAAVVLLRRRRRVDRVLRVLIIGVVAGVVLTLGVWRSSKQLSVEDRDTARFGTKVQYHVDPSAVKARFLDHAPALTDAGPDGEDGTAVPVDQYALNGRLLTLLAAHYGTCRPTIVLLGPARAGLGVIVVVGPATLPSIGPRARTAYCRTDPPDGPTVHTAIDVDLPGWLNASSVSDVGGGGAAARVTDDQ